MLKQKNVQPHVEIDGGDILNFTSYNYLPHPSFQVKRMGVIFFVNFFVAILSLKVSSNLGLTFLSHVKR